MKTSGSSDLRSHPARDFILEDYRMWLRELEKQDRWFAQAVWLIVAAWAAAMPVARQFEGRNGAIAAVLITLIGLLFVSLNADFLASRVLTHRQVSRRVAGMRAAVGMTEALSLPPELAYSGSPMLSTDPKAFVRTMYAGKAIGFRHIFLMQFIALAALYAVLALFLSLQMADVPGPTEPQVYMWIVAGTASLHLCSFSTVFRWRVSEAQTLGEFLVTLARDKGVGVVGDAEERLKQWVRSGTATDLLSGGERAVRVIVAYEDKRFWRHPGVDLIALASVVRGRRAGGATTIPMQLARQLIRSPHVGSRWARLKRKQYEAAMGMYLVRRYGRRFVLATWLKTIPFGRSSVIGIEAAARKYLGKAVRDLDELDGLLLAERVTVYTGRYYTERVLRLVRWAVRRGLVPANSATEAQSRIARMQEGVPSEPRQ